MKTKQEIKDLLNPFFTREDSHSKVDQCGRITSISKLELEDNDFSAKSVEGKFEHNGISVDHSFVVIPADEVEEAEEKTVIIDGTLEQFGNETETSINLDSVDNLPSIAVLTSEDEYYTKYIF